MEQTDRLPPCPDPQCDTIAALLATIALGSDISVNEQAQILSYISTCARCRLRLDGFAGVAQALPLSVAPSEPPPALRERIIAAAAQRQPRQPRPRPLPRARRDWRTMLTGGFALATLLLALFAGQLFVRGEQQRQQMARNRAVVIAAFGNDDAREAQFVPSQRAPAASGRVLVSPGEPAVVVYAKQLPPLAAGEIYQVWLQSGASVIGVGTFVPDANNRVWALLGPSSVLPPPETIFITAERAPGGQQPGGVEMLRASFP